MEFAESSSAGKTYTLTAVDDGDDVTLRLGDGTTDDDVKITAGTNITIDPVAEGGFTIAATGSGGGSGILSDLTVDYTNRSSPCTLPITVTEPSSGTKQINIPDNSNAFGVKYVQTSEPTGTSVCDGDIWYDTGSGSGGGVSAHLTVFTNSGTFTPPAGTSSHIVWVTGGGGGSGAATGEYDDSSINGFSGSGGAGATVVRRYSSAEMGNSASVTVGAGGNGGINITDSGGTGGTSTFNPGGTGTTLTANGGVGSGYANETTTNGGAGGTGSGGQYGFNGGNGVRGNYGGDSGHYEEGGNSFYGQNTYGSGGDGRRRYASGTQNGQDGNGGIVVVKSF